MDEPDIYGDDIYGDAAAGFGSGNAAAPEQAQPTEAKVAASDGPTMDSPTGREAELQAQLQQANAALTAWQRAFPADDAVGALPGASISPTAAAESLQKAREEAAAARGQLQTATQRIAALEYALAEKSVENVQLRRSLHVARQAADPSIVQVRQLLLDPAVNREFQRLRAELDEKAREVKHLQQELQAVNFSQDSKTGRMLMAKCRALQDENEEMGRELAEGKVHGLERQVALAKGFGDDLRRAYAQLEDHTTALDRENEDLQGQLFLMRRQLRDLETQLEAARTSRASVPNDLPPSGYDKGFHTGMSRKRPPPPDPRDMRDSGNVDHSRRRMR